MDIKGGHLVARYLKEVEGIETVFALSGGHIEAILDGFTQYQIRAIDVRHEQVAAMAAHAWSVYAKKTGVCLVTAGPGFTNALTGIANAYLDNAPLVVLCGKHPLKDDLRGALQEMNQIDMVKPVTKWAATCYETKRIPEYLSMAFRYATMGRPGPVFLELPPDVLNISIPEEDAPLPSHPTRKYTVHPDDADLKQAADLINSARQPLFLGGSGVGFSCCHDALKGFVEKTGIPFLLMNYGRGELADNHPQSLWDVGNIGMMVTLAQADLIVIAGLRLNWLLQSGAALPSTAKIVRIDIDPLINNDCTWGMVKHGQELSIGKDRLQCTELALRRYDKMVEALGGHGEFVTKDAEIIPAIKRALESGKPACVNVITDPAVMSPASVIFYQALKLE